MDYGSRLKPDRRPGLGAGSGTLGRESAQALALEALAWLAAEDDRLHRFLAESGLQPDALHPGTLAARLADGRADLVLAGVLDHLLADEVLLFAFAAESGHDPAGPKLARRVFPGWEYLDG